MWEIDLIGPIIFSKLVGYKYSWKSPWVTSFRSLACVLDKPFFSFLGTSSIKIFLLFLWNGHFNCLHFTSYMVCSMDIYWSGKDYFGTHLTWPFTIVEWNSLLLSRWCYNLRFFQADSTSSHARPPWCCQPEKISWYGNITNL